MTQERGPAAYADETPSLEELTQHLSPQIDELAGVELLVGIPCYNSEGTVANVVLDSGSTDDTVEIGLRASTSGDQDLLLIPRAAPLPKHVSTTLEGIRGKGNALRPLFTIARATGARALACFDSDLRSIRPEWVEHLLGRVLEDGFDHVTPMYLRHKHDGTITNSIAYPLTSALYGTVVRQPIGGDFGFSGTLAKFWAEHEDVWTTEVARFGIDIWMTTSAIADGFRIAQARLGSKIHAPKDPGEHLGPMFRQVVGTIFRLAGPYQHRWQAVDEITTAPSFGFPFVTGTDALAVNVPGLIERFRTGTVEFDDVLRSALAAETLAAVSTIASGTDAPDRFTFPVELWIDVVYDLLVATNAGVVAENRLLAAMIPLYFARTASFVHEAADDDTDAAEARIDSYPRSFLERKSHLRSNWESSNTLAG
ncbi:MAG: glycosyl transferase family 2 [Actinomycetota bacterium]